MTRFHSLLRERIEKHVVQESLSLAGGNLSDHAAYKYQCGYIAGLRAALSECDVIEGEFDGSNRSG